MDINVLSWNVEWDRMQFLVQDFKTNTVSTGRCNNGANKDVTKYDNDNPCNYDGIPEKTDCFKNIEIKMNVLITLNNLSLFGIQEGGCIQNMKLDKKFTVINNIIGTKKTVESMIGFNNQIFNLIREDKGFVNGLIINGKTKYGRVYQLAALNITGTSKNLLFINVHFTPSHGTNEENNVIKFYFDFINTKITEKFSDINFDYIIMTGDFNLVLNAFEKTNIKLLNKQLTIHNTNLKTLGNAGIDNILSNGLNFNNISIPITNNLNYSDHLPLLAKFKLPLTVIPTPIKIPLTGVPPPKPSNIDVTTDIHSLAKESFKINNKSSTDKTEYNRLITIIKANLIPTVISPVVKGITPVVKGIPPHADTVIPIDGKGNVAYVIEHQNKRFKELSNLLESNLSLHVIIAGDATKGTHALGTGIAKSSWIDKVEYDKMLLNITVLVKNLLDKYKKRVELGAIGFAKNHDSNHKDRKYCNKDLSKDPSSNWIHVWGANVGNWNKKNGEKFYGTGQVESFYENVNTDKYVIQKSGIFGVITMPLNTEQETKDALANSNYM
jgi:hypothetical protein